MAQKRTFKSNNNVVYSCTYHVVWTTKYRRKMLTGEIDMRLKAIAQDVADELQCDIIAMDVMPDHVHILCEVDPQFGVHRFVRRIKGRTSRLLRDEFETLRTRLPTLWTNAYFVATVGGAPMAVIRQYIESQQNV